MRVFFLSSVVLVGTLFFSVFVRCQKQPSTAVKVSGQSVVRNLDFGVLSALPNGTVVLGGRAFVAKVESSGRAGGGAVLVEISDESTRVRRLPFLSSIDGIVFANDSTGWLFQIGKGVLRSVDGGELWERIEDFGDIRGPLFFLDRNLGWYFGADEFFKRSKKNQVENLCRFAGFPFVKKLQFTSPDSGWLYDVIDGSPRFQHTEDGGKTWEIVKTDDGSGVIDFQFADPNEGFVLTGSGLYSVNASGKLWKLLRKQSGRNSFVRLFFLDQKTGWAVAEEKSCFTDDAGSNWTCWGFDKKLGIEHIRSVVFIDAINGWLLADEGLYSTKNGGKSWQRYPINVEGMSF
jgi:photosystem II stability/assembly factor-like uncharacterized protein